ncbi:hypothetical protein ABZ297_38595 [Nonomuraea sp. NPDC005983]|uniref:NACHT domain-containing protein n=1 Tax=Nonomuraea sp. NPDC005983 TaxID=3155595 RepID=UPI0033B0D861
MVYNLEQLGPIGFQDLAAALAMQTFGAGVQVMGAGRDGGRDLYFKGPLVWQPAEGQSSEVWDGYTVFQVKHKDQLAARPQDDTSWLWGHVRKELDAWADPAKGRNPVPDHLVIITNVPLTPVPGSGGHDTLNDNIQRYIDALADDSRDIGDGAERKGKLARLSRLRKWRLWDGNQIQALLHLYPGVRQAFPGFLTATDVFANLAEIAGSLPLDQLEPGLRAHARTTLIGEGAIYFDEAGSSDGKGLPVHEVAIDLPVTVGGGAEHGSVIRHVLDRGEHMLRPTLTTRRGPRHLIVAGAPGNGKTTISKFLVQAYRAAMLAGASNLSGEHQDVISGMEQALARLGAALPRHRRWAMRVDLAEYAHEHGTEEDTTLIRYIAERVSKRSDLGNVMPSAMSAWMRRWPWFLVLDGLDEVTDPTVRKRLIERVTELVTAAEGDDCDLFVVLTTRPIGYTENIAPTQFERIDLDYLQPDEAVRYGTLVTTVRLGNDQDRVEKIVTQLCQAADDEGLRNLLRTPLQVLIMTIILGGAGSLAPDRFSLFWTYYEIVFKRERDKQTSFNRILQEHGLQIQQLHERIGFELQARSESGDRSNAALTHQELENLTWQVLDEAGFKPSGADADLRVKIVTAATRRLVLIAPRGDEGYGFDVRSLQELMAAMHLTTGPLERVTQRLRTAAASPHWRNTWIFAAGRLYSTPQDHQHQAVVELVETIDEGAEARLGTIVPIGPRLALDLIDDGMARSWPKWRDRLITCGLRVLQGPGPASLDFLAIARILVRFAGSGDTQHHLVAEGVRDALGGTPTAQAMAVDFLTILSALAKEADALPQALALSKIVPRASMNTPDPPPDGWADFEEEIQTSPLSGDALLKVTAAATAIRRFSQGGGSAADAEAVLIVELRAALEDDQAAQVLAAALNHVVAHEPMLVATLRDEVLPAVHRASVGELLR